MRQLGKYSFYLIATYLVVAYATGSGSVISAGSTGAVGLIKAFQGRN